MKAIYKSMLRTIVLIFLFSSALIGQKENKTVGKDSIRYRLTNLTDAAQAIQANPNEIHLGDYTGFESDNQYEDELLAIALKVHNTLGFDVYDLGLWPMMSYTHEGVSQSIDKIKEDIISEKYVLYHYNIVADQTIGDITFIVVDKVNGVSTDLSLVAEIVNMQLNNFMTEDFVFLKRVLVEVKTLEYFSNYFLLENKFISVLEESGSLLRSNDPPNYTMITDIMPGLDKLLSLSGIVFKAENVKSLIYPKKVLPKGYDPQYTKHVSGMVLGFTTSDDKTYIAISDGQYPPGLKGYAYIDEKGDRVLYKPEVITDTDAEVWLGFKNLKCPESSESCNMNGYLVKLFNYKSSTNNDPEAPLSGPLYSYEELALNIKDVAYSLNENNLQDWLIASGVPNFETQKPCMPLITNLDGFIRISNSSDVINIGNAAINIDGVAENMWLLNSNGIIYGIHNNVNGPPDYYYWNHNCYSWRPLLLSNTEVIDGIGQFEIEIIEALNSIDFTDPHIYIEAGQTIITIVGIAHGGGAIWVAAGVTLAIIDGALYWHEGDNTNAFLAFAGAAVDLGVIKLGGKFVMALKGVPFDPKFISRMGTKVTGVKLSDLTGALNDAKKGKEFIEDVIKVFKGAEKGKGSPFMKFMALNKDKGVKAWEIISDLHSNIRTKVLNLKVVRKLENIGLDPNLSEAHKRIRKIIKNLDGAGNKGIHISNRIISGELDDISGLSKVLNKSTDSGYLNAAKQAIDKADEVIASGVQKNRLVFEDEVPGVYDVDVGIKSVSGSPIYEKAYQLKSVETPNAVKNNLGSNQVSQIIYSPSASKVYEVEMRSGTFTELEGIEDFWANLNQTKSEYPKLQIQVKDINGVIKKY